MIGVGTSFAFLYNRCHVNPSGQEPRSPDGTQLYLHIKGPRISALRLSSFWRMIHSFGAEEMSSSTICAPNIIMIILQIPMHDRISMMCFT